VGVDELADALEVQRRDAEGDGVAEALVGGDSHQRVHLVVPAADDSPCRRCNP
jgi:hypothetical protein